MARAIFGPQGAAARQRRKVVAHRFLHARDTLHTAALRSKTHNLHGAIFLVEINSAIGTHSERFQISSYREQLPGRLVSVDGYAHHPAQGTSRGAEYCRFAVECDRYGGHATAADEIAEVSIKHA